VDLTGKEGSKRNSRGKEQSPVVGAGGVSIEGTGATTCSQAEGPGGDAGSRRRSTRGRKY